MGVREEPVEMRERMAAACDSSRFSSSAVDGPRCFFFFFGVEAKANNTTRGQGTNKNLIIITVRTGRSRKRIEPKENGNYL